MVSRSFLESLIESNIYVGRVALYVPNSDGSGLLPEPIYGFMEDELSLNLGNTWASILPDAEVANQIGQLLGAQNQLTWIQSSACTWKSTQPLEFDVNIYLVTLSEGQSPSVLEDAKSLMKLLTLHVEGDDWATAKVHGGYHVDYFTSNNNLDNINLYFTKTKSAKNILKGGRTSVESNYSSTLSSLARSIAGQGDAGTISLALNNRIFIRNLLLSKANFTISSAYVTPDTPLYIKMNLSFRSTRALLDTDIENLMGN